MVSHFQRLPIIPWLGTRELCVCLHSVIVPAWHCQNRMDYRKEDNGLLTFVEHWNILIAGVITVIAIRGANFFMKLSGAPWLWFFSAAFALMIFGGGLISYAKLPVYRSGRFFTFGRKSVPVQLQAAYRWGWRMFLFGVVLSLCLLLSKP
jgi:hypothetical protein